MKLAEEAVQIAEEGIMEWFRDILKECLSRDDRGCAMACVIGALKAAVEGKNLEQAQQFIDIMEEEGLFDVK